MFGNFGNPVTAYKSVSVDSSVNSADPHLLIALLFDGGLAAIATAKGEMSRGNIAQKGTAISKAIDIIENGLSASINMNVDSDLPEKLKALYEYMIARLLHANLKNDSQALDEVAQLLGEIRDAWNEIRDQVAKSQSL